MNQTHVADGMQYLRSALLSWVGFFVASWLGEQAQALSLNDTIQGSISLVAHVAFASAFLFTNLTIVDRVFGRRRAY